MKGTDKQTSIGEETSQRLRDSSAGAAVVAVVVDTDSGRPVPPDKGTGGRAAAAATISSPTRPFPSIAATPVNPHSGGGGGDDGGGDTTRSSTTARESSDGGTEVDRACRAGLLCGDCPGAADAAPLRYCG